MADFDIEFPVKDLVAALSIVTSIIDRRNVNPVLACIKLEIQDNNLIIQGTDGSIFVTQTLGSKVRNSSISVAVDGRLLERMLRGLSDELVKITYLSDSNELLVSSTNFELKLVILDTESFPVFPEVQPKIQLEIPCKEISDLINYTEFSSSNEEVRYNLNGICLHTAEGNKIVAVATDGFRLSTFYIENEALNSKFRIIIPSKTVAFLKHLHAPAFENHNAKIKISNNIIEISVLNTLIVSKLIDGTFPEYENLIPKCNNNKLTIQKSYFATAIERISAITDERSKAIQISISDTVFKVSAYTQSKGEAKQYIPAPFFQYSGQSMEIAFQPRYLLDILGIIKGPDDTKIDIFIKDHSSPIVITYSKLEKGRFVVMPVKI